MDSNPLVSIVIPLYNYERYVFDCLRSCINQTYKNIEIIVIDDCSTDYSVDVVDLFIEDSGDERIRLIKHHRNMGYSFAKNTGIIKSNGELIVHLDSDDMLTVDSIECRVEEFLKDENVVFVHGLGMKFHGDKKYEWCCQNIESLKAGTGTGKVHAQGVMLKKELYVKYGLYEERLKARSDREMWIRLRDIAGIDMKKINKKVAFYRKHSESMGSFRRNNPEYNKELSLILKRCVKSRRKEGINRTNTRFMNSPHTDPFMTVSFPHKSRKDSGKVIFYTKLEKELKLKNVRIINNINESHDISVIGLFRKRIPNSKRKIIRIDGVNINKDFRSDKDFMLNFHESDGIIYQSMFGRRAADKYLEKFKKKSKIIYNGSPLGYYDVENVKKKYKYNFIGIAKWRPNKRFTDIIESFLLADIDDSCLFVAGDISGSGVSDEDMGRYSKIENIKFLGEIDNKQLGNYFAICDACIHLCWIDCCPNVVIESLTSGCPVISGNMGGTPELVSLAGGIVCDIDRECDLKYISTKNIPKIDRSKVAEAIVKSMEEKIIVDGRCFDIKNIAKQYLDFFHEVLSGNVSLTQDKSRIM